MNSYDAHPDDPFVELSHTVRLSIILGAIFMTVIAVIAISGVSIAWYGLRSDVERNEATIVALCRQNNDLRKDIITIALDLGVPHVKLTSLEVRPCNLHQLREEFPR